MCVGGGHHGGLSHPEARYDRMFFAFGDGEAFYNPLPLAGETIPPFCQFLSLLGGILDSDFEPLFFVAFWRDGGEKRGGY